jgi:hypothetical protein
VSNQFANGKLAYGFCDRCSFRYDLKDLQFQIFNMRSTNMKVCPTCMDIDNPQLQLGRFPVSDPQALRDPRPDQGLVSSRDITWGWWPLLGYNATTTVGTVTIVIT